MTLHRLASLAAALIAMTACAPKAQAERHPPPPTGAHASVEEGPQELRLDNVVLQIRQAVQDRRRPLEVVTYRLPPGVAWTSVRNHYDQALGWPHDPRLPEGLRGALARAWRKGDREFAIALIERPVAGADEPRPILVVAASDPG
jgi:hypothetical protein